MTEQAPRVLGLIAAMGAAALLLATGALALPQRAAAQTACVSTIDLMLVLDGSESITAPDFETMKSFAGSLVGHFTISPDDAHAGVVQFAGEGQGRVETGLSSDAAAVDAAVAAMTQIVGATDIQEGLALAREQLAAGGRAGVAQVVIVLTDGAHNQPGDPVAEAEAARGAGAEIFAIAVGSGPDMAQLGAIAERVFSVSDFDALVTILDPLVQVVCPLVLEPPLVELPPVQEGPEPESGLPVVGLPATGSHSLPDDWPQRGAKLAAQGLAGLGSAALLIGAGWWLRRRAGR